MSISSYFGDECIKLGYAQSLLVISKLASSSEINTEAKDFQKALILGRLLDKDVNFGYKQ